MHWIQHHTATQCAGPASDEIMCLLQNSLLLIQVGSAACKKFGNEFVPVVQQLVYWHIAPVKCSKRNTARYCTTVKAQGPQVPSAEGRLYPAWIQIARLVSSHTATWFARAEGSWLGQLVHVPACVSNFHNSWFKTQSLSPPWIQIAELDVSHTATCWLRGEGPAAGMFVHV